MRNFIAKGNNIVVTAPVGGLASGQLYRVGKLIVVASSSGPEGEQVAANLTGVYLVPKETGVQVAQGDALYFVDATGVLNITMEGNTFAGYAYEGATAADTSVLLILSH